MSDDDNIVRFPKASNANVKTPLPKEERDQIVEERTRLAKEAQLRTLDSVRALIEAGTLDSFAIIGLSPVGAILTEFCPPGTHRYDYPAVFLGAMVALQSEFVDMVQSMPQMLNDGTIVAHSDMTVL